MEGDKKRSKDDTWKSSELKKHLKASPSESHSEDSRHRQRRPRERGSSDSDDLKGDFHKEQEKDKVKSKEKTGEKARFKSSERHKDERKEKARDKERSREPEKEKAKVMLEKHAKEEKYLTGKSREKHSGKERERKHKKDDPHKILAQNPLEVYGQRDKDHQRRRGSKDHTDHSKVKDEEREKKHLEKKNEESKNNLGAAAVNRDEDGEYRLKSHKEQELDRDRKIRHKEKKEHGLSASEGKEKYTRLKNPASFKDSEEHATRRHKDRPYYDAEERHASKKHRDRTSYDAEKEHKAYYEDKHHRESSERRHKEESEKKKTDIKHSEYKSNGKSSKQEDEIDHPPERNTKEKVKNHGKSERENTKQKELRKDTTNPECDDNSVNYEDDFEDYEDDFDDFDDEEGEDNQEQKPVEEVAETVRKVARNSEIEEIQKAINAENEMIESFVPKQIKNESFPKDFKKEMKPEKHDPPAQRPASGKFIDFQTAKQRQNIRKIASEHKKRNFELLRLVDLDFSVSFCLLDLPPVNEYDMYIRNFGKINTKQAYVQWNEDNVDRDVQTEEIDRQEKWTQHPGETAVVVGGPKSSSSVSVLTPKVDSQRLSNFLRSACQVIEVLLEEDQVATQPRRNLRSRASSLSISDRCFQLNTGLPFLNGRRVSYLHISQAQRQALLSVHQLPEKSGDLLLLDSKYIICVWNVWQPSSPQKLLLSESQVTCCCFSPSKATLVFAGTVDGSVLAWDLREDSRMHQSMKVNETEWTFRSPTFSTDGIFAAVNHMCPVLTIEPVSTSVFREQNCGLSYFSSQDEMLGLSFQIASMDENGTLNLWVVVELQKGDLAGSQSDLGLIPGGKIKLVHSSTLQLNCSFSLKDASFLGAPQTVNIKFLPSNPNNFVVGTDMAVVIHGTRHELKVPPKWFKPEQRELRSTRVNTIDFSPFGKPIFLVGCSDGSIRLHQMSSELPLMQWNNSTMGQPVIALQWALTRPAVFFVLDATSVVYIWDLLENDLAPVAKQPIWSDKVITMAVLGEPEKSSGVLGIALAKESGIIDIKYVKKKWALPQAEESEKLNLLLQRAL